MDADRLPLDGAGGSDLSRDPAQSGGRHHVAFVLALYLSEHEVKGKMNHENEGTERTP